MTDLRDQIATEIHAATPQTYADALRSADAVLAVLREQSPHPWYVNAPLLRNRIEGLRRKHDPQARGGGAHSYWGALDDVLALFEDGDA